MYVDLKVASKYKYSCIIVYELKTYIPKNFPNFFPQVFVGKYQKSSYIINIVKMYMFNQEFVIALLSFTIVMVIFNLVKDMFLIPYLKVTDKDSIDKINKRWYISFFVGTVLLFLIYGRAGP